MINGIAIDSRNILEKTGDDVLTNAFLGGNIASKDFDVSLGDSRNSENPASSQDGLDDVSHRRRHAPAPLMAPDRMLELEADQTTQPAPEERHGGLNGTHPKSP